MFAPERFPRALSLARETVVVTPTFRERDTIAEHVDSVLCGLPGISLLVVDDDSPDGTADVVAELAKGRDRLHLIRRPGPRSFTGSYQDGLKWALERGFTRVVSMDADGSHSALFLPLLLDLSTEADLVVGSRYLFGVSVLNWPLRRVLLSAFANLYASFVTRVRCTDLTSGFCCYRTEALKRIDLPDFRASGYAYQIEMKYRLWRSGAQLAETNILFIERLAGTSKISSGRIWEGLRHPWWCRFVLGRGPSPPPAPIYRGWEPSR